MLATRELDVDLETWVLLENLVWEVGDEGTGIEFVVPAGYVTDGATVPKPLSYLIARWGPLSPRGGAARPALPMDSRGEPKPLLPDALVGGSVFLGCLRGMWRIDADAVAPLSRRSDWRLDRHGNAARELTLRSPRQAIPTIAWRPRSSIWRAA